MKRFALPILIVLFMSASSAIAQRQWSQQKHYAYKPNKIQYEYGFGAGISNFLGELGGANAIGTNFARDLDMRSTRYAFTGFGRIYYHRRIAQKFDFTYTKIYGDDAETKEPARNNRNLSFRSPIFELGTQIEVYLVAESQNNPTSRLSGTRKKGNNPVNLYLFGGVSGFYMNPKGQAPNGKWVALQPLRTEGQGAFPTRKPYSRIQLAIPFGLGFNVRCTPKIRIGFEASLRKTFTDYMDDVSTTYVDPSVFATSGSKDPALAAAMADKGLGNIPGATAAGQQRGDPRDKDSFMTLVLNISFRIGKGKTSMPKFF